MLNIFFDRPFLLRPAKRQRLSAVSKALRWSTKATNTCPFFWAMLFWIMDTRVKKKKKVICCRVAGSEARLFFWQFVPVFNPLCKSLTYNIGKYITYYAKERNPSVITPRVCIPFRVYWDNNGLWPKFWQISRVKQPKFWQISRVKGSTEI